MLKRQRLSKRHTTQSLTTQLRDVARAFCIEVWGEALNAAGVSANGLGFRE